MNVRPNLCAAYGPGGTYTAKQEFPFDIGVYTKNCTFEFCQPCINCSSASRLSIEDMKQYKYQILADGHAASYDSTAWKLSSNSVVFAIKDDSRDDLLWDLFFFPLFRPNREYIPTSIRNLAAAVTFCKQNDDFRRRMAERATDRSTCIFHADFMVHLCFLGPDVRA